MSCRNVPEPCALVLLCLWLYLNWLLAACIMNPHVQPCMDGTCVGLGHNYFYINKVDHCIDHIFARLIKVFVRMIPNNWGKYELMWWRVKQFVMNDGIMTVWPQPTSKYFKAFDINYELSQTCQDKAHIFIWSSGLSLKLSSKSESTARSQFKVFFSP